MPELPEVETIRKGFEKYVVGHKIVGVDVRLKKILQGDTDKLVGGKVKSVRRFGKALSIDLDPPSHKATEGQVPMSIVAHIKLTGQFIYDGPERPKGAEVSPVQVGELPSKHTHLIFELDRGGKLYYNDIRQFGWIKIVPTEEVVKLPFVHELGPEPFVGQDSSGQAKLTLDKFRGILGKSSTKIKALLMDQKKIGGIGNIYANDALFLARIDPSRPAKSLSFTEQNKLYKSVEEVLRRGLKYGGATEMSFVNVLGQSGGYQKYFLVYGREGEACLGKCGGTIKKIRLGGRGTYYCPRCQK